MLHPSQCSKTGCTEPWVTWSMILWCVTLKLGKSLGQVPYTASWDSCEPFPALSEMPLQSTTPCLHPTWALLTPSLPSKYPTCPCLFHHLLLSLMLTFTTCESFFNVFPTLHLPQPSSCLLSHLSPTPTFIFHSASIPYSPYGHGMWLQNSFSRSLLHAAQLCQPSAPHSLLCHSLCDPGCPSLSLEPSTSNLNLPSISYTLLQFPHSLFVKSFLDAGTALGSL